MARCLVLGANGFIGSHLVDSLVEQGHTVRAFDRFSGDVLFQEHPNVEIVSGDFLNRGDITDALKDIEYVFHFISTTTPATAENDPLIDISTNIRMSVELFEECVEAGVKRVIFASTGGAIYGEGDNPHKEEDLPLPVSPYAIGKLTIEHYLRYFRVKHGLDSVVLRISNPYGERQSFHRKQGVIPIFLENIYRGKPLTILGDGSMVRDYIYVKDVATIAASIFDKETQNKTYNVGSGQGVTVNELVSVVERVSNKTAEIESRPAPTTFLHEVVLDTSRFTNEFGVLTQTTLEDGMRATYAYIAREIDKDSE